MPRICLTANSRNDKQSSVKTSEAQGFADVSVKTSETMTHKVRGRFFAKRSTA
ncbi:MAG: hypothetical protein IJJ58_04860 [Campylobacter sp.]|nr:hypothetical protein [Campylobacter sp.]